VEEGRRLEAGVSLTYVRSSPKHDHIRRTHLGPAQPVLTSTVMT
jgi:hypothetical protein